MNSFVKTLCIIFLILFASLSANAGGTYYVKVGEEKMLSFTPKSGFLNNTMAWRSYDTSCVSVKGPQYTSYTYVKALAATTSARGALVQCEYKYMWNGFALTATEDFYIIVEDNTPKEPTGISMQSSLTLNVGDSYTLYPTVYPSGVSTSITWSTNNRNVASVTSGGRVTGESEGTATIYATTHNGYYTSCNVTVTKPTATVSISNTNTLLTKPTKIALKSTPTSANIYYTLDGSTPTTSSSLYSDSLLINKNTTLKAIAVASGYYDSPVLTKEFEYTTLDVVDTYPANGVAIIMRSKLTPIIKFNQRIYKGENFDNIKITNGSSPIIGEFAIAYDALYFKPENEFKSGKISLTIPKDAVMTDNNEINPEVRFTFEIKDTLRCVNMSASTSHTIATKNDGSLWAWGYNSYGQLGDGTTTNKTTPIKIMDNVVSTSASRYHSLAIKNDGSLWAWGRNSYGQLGDGTTTNKTTPVKIMDNVVSTSAGLYHSLAIKNDGSLWAWGYNNCGQLGDGTTTNKTTPVKIMDNVVSTSAGLYHSLAIKNDGSLWAWGYNNCGQLGDGTTTNKTTPVKIMDNVVSTSAGLYHSLAIKNDGSLWAWGLNANGQLGDGTTTNKNTPVKIMDNVVSTSTGYYHSLAIKNDGSLWAWGKNSDGQLGDGTTTNKNTPVKIMDGVISTSTGYYHSLAIKNDGSLWAWGDNYYGQLGVGDTKDRIVPTSVWTVSEPKEVDDVTLHNIEIEEDKFIMYPILNPTDGDYTDIQWESSNKDVAEVDEYGVITAKSEGVATITAKITRLSGDIISANSEITVSTITDISKPTENHISFKIKNNTIVVKDYENDDRPQLYTISGNAIQPNNDTNNVLSFGPLNKGIYILRFNHFNKKIMIK